MKGYRLYSASLGFALCACGSGEATLRDDLVGSWITSGDSIAVSYTFIEDGTYEYNLAYLLNPQLEIFVIAGNYELRRSATGVADNDGAYLFLQPRLASCPVGPSPVGFTVALQDDSLFLSGETAVTAYERIVDVGDSDDGAAQQLPRYGCFTREGFFSYPLQEF